MSVIYNKETGKIISSSNMIYNEETLQQIFNDGYGVINDEVYVDYVKFYVEDDNLIPIPNRPGDCYIFDYEKKKWILNVKKLELEERSKRNQLLSDSDWTQLADVDLTDKNKLEWKEYRQQLRDITNQANFPFEVDYPEPPK